MDGETAVVLARMGYACELVDAFAFLGATDESTSASIGLAVDLCDELVSQCGCPLAERDALREELCRRWAQRRP